jgi:leader peptidase (prepilin peptidase)/N-methyltransferase
MIIWLAAIFGLLIGSFLNVCIYRWPRDLSVVKPRSRCSSCEKQIVWYDNLPILSYFLLRGRCRNCAAVIPWRYPAVEAFTSLAFAWSATEYGLTPGAAKMCIFAAIMIGLIFSDLETRLLPDEFTIGGGIIGIALSLLVPIPGSFAGLLAATAGLAPPPRALSFAESLLGAGIPAGAMWLMGWLFEKIRHKEGLGFGDVKMVAMVGAFLGLQGALLTVVVGSMLGSIVGLAWIRLTSKDASEYQLPFATFLGVAGLVVAVMTSTLARLIG